MNHALIPALPLLLLAAACSETPPEVPVDANAAIETLPPENAVDYDPAETPRTSPTDLASPVPLKEIPDVFRGEWNRVPADCGTARNDSRLTIEADRIRFHESVGWVTAVTLEGRTMGVTAQYTGEGGQWEATRTFTLSADRQKLAQDGMERIRCP